MKKRTKQMLAEYTRLVEVKRKRLGKLADAIGRAGEEERRTKAFKDVEARLDAYVKRVDWIDAQSVSGEAVAKVEK